MKKSTSVVWLPRVRSVRGFYEGSPYRTFEFGIVGNKLKNPAKNSKIVRNLTEPSSSE